MDAVDQARAELLRSFRWTGGHTDFALTLRNPAFLEAAGSALVRPFEDAEISSVVALEARGFVLGALAARSLGVGLILARKPGSVHPGSATEVADTPDWRGRHIEVRISASAVRAGDRLLLVDDWVETGSQARTVVRLVERLGGRVVGVSAVVDDTTDEVRTALGVVGLIRSSELPPDT